MTNNPNSSPTVKQHWNREKTKEKLQDIFNLKMFRYTLIKMLKSPSTYVMFILTFLLHLIMVISIAANIIRDPRDWTVTISENYVLYSWIFYIIYFTFCAMYIAFKSTQIIRDEMDDGTLLIFASIPISRVKMIFEKWLALQLTCLLYGVITLLFPILISMACGDWGYAFGNYALGRVGYMILTSFIVQLLLSTIAILLSLSLNSKGVIGILFVIGFLSIIGAIIPMIYNASNNSRSNMYLNNTSNLGKNFKTIIGKAHPSQELVTALTNPTGWPLWTADDTPNTRLSFNENLRGIYDNRRYSLAPNLNATTFATQLNNALTEYVTATTSYDNWNNFYMWVISQGNKYADLVKFGQFNDHNGGIVLDGADFNIVDNISKTVKINNNQHEGLNLINQFYQAALKAATGTPTITIKNDTQVKGDSTSVSPNVINPDLLATSQDKEIYHLLKATYDSKFLNNSLATVSSMVYGTPNGSNYGTSWSQLLSNALTSAISPAAPGGSILIDDIKNLVQENYDSHTYQEAGAYLVNGMYSTIYKFANLLFNYTLTSIYNGDQNDLDSSPDAWTATKGAIDGAIVNYKLMGYLNIWQQWVIMWTGNDRPVENSPLSGMFLPLNNYITPTVKEVNYQNNAIDYTLYYLAGDFNQAQTIDSLGGMYAAYILISLGLAGLVIWRVCRKDFV
ncbi:ABC transporter permease [Spiroplasma sp. DGKH1]|uniref:ABC transporter permease n=1 Tax=Spiroplasma sp. DGKH1 TaxID=3050074 RepID=UPI0034C6A825